MKSTTWILALSFVTTACVTEEGEPTEASVAEELTLTGSTPSACSVPTPGTARIVALTFDGQPIGASSLTAADRYALGLTAAHGGVYGDGDWSCDFHDHGAAGHSVICSNKATGVTCGFHNWNDGPEVGCDDPANPTC